MQSCHLYSFCKCHSRDLKRIVGGFKKRPDRGIPSIEDLMHRAQQLLPWGQSLWHYGASLYGKAWNNNPETERLQTLTKLHPISPGTVNFRDLNGSKTWWTILAEHPTSKLTYIVWVSGSYDLYDLWPYIPVWGIKHFGRIDHPSTAATTTLKIPLRPRSYSGTMYEHVCAVCMETDILYALTHLAESLGKGCKQMH